LRAALPAAAQCAVLDAGGHSPHSERGTADEVTRLGGDFVGRVLSDPPRNAGSEGPGLRTDLQGPGLCTDAETRGRS
jgi:hypothetical protein